MEELSRVKLGRIKDFVEKVESATNSDDVEIGMEVFISAFFPDAYDNLKQQLTQTYILGYNDGKKDYEKELEDDCK